MLTLPQGTLPPLPAQYATAKTVEPKSNSTTIDPSSSSDLSSTIAEQIRQILSTNLIKSSSLNSTDEQISNIIKNEEKNICQTKNNLNEGGEKDYNHYQQKSQPSFSYSKSNPNSVAVVAPSFHYSSSSSIPTNGNSSNSFMTSNFSSFDSINSPLKQTTTTSSSSIIPNFGSQYLYPTSSSIPTQNVFPTLSNSAAADAAAAIFQAYSQFNARPTPTIPIINQQTNTQHQQIQK